MKPSPNRESRRQIIEFRISTPDGEFIAHYSDEGLCGLHFPPGGASANPTGRTAEPPESVKSWHALTVEALTAALTGREPDRYPPLDLSAGSAFQQRVWRALLEIKSGQTKSYGEVASAIGNPKALRAVGGACGANPMPVLVPCHRVLAAHQRIGGFSSDLNWKRKLLAREGIRLQDA
jgi:O-6-methylguanine DNA methyltransferase